MAASDPLGAGASASRPTSPDTIGSRRSRTARREVRELAGERISGLDRHLHPARSPGSPPSSVSRYAPTVRACMSIEKSTDRAEDPELAHALGRDAGGRQVGHAPSLEGDAGVGDVDEPRQDGHAGGADLEHRPPHEGRDDLEVVDHQVQHDVDVEAARREDAEPLGLDEDRVLDPGQNGLHGRVVALDVADLRARGRARARRATSASASRPVAVIGFSTRTSRPRSQKELRRARA